MEGRPVWWEWSHVGDKATPGDIIQRRESKGKRYAGFFSLLSFSLPPKPSWSHLARESGKVVCRGRMPPPQWITLQVDKPPAHRRVWGRAGERLRRRRADRKPKPNGSYWSSRARLARRVKEPEHWAKLISKAWARESFLCQAIVLGPTGNSATCGEQLRSFVRFLPL